MSRLVTVILNTTPEMFSTFMQKMYNAKLNQQVEDRGLIYQYYSFKGRDGNQYHFAVSLSKTESGSYNVNIDEDSKHFHPEFQNISSDFARWRVKDVLQQYPEYTIVNEEVFEDGSASIVIDYLDVEQ